MTESCLPPPLLLPPRTITHNHGVRRTPPRRAVAARRNSFVAGQPMGRSKALFENESIKWIEGGGQDLEKNPSPIVALSGAGHRRQCPWEYPFGPLVLGELRRAS